LALVVHGGAAQHARFSLGVVLGNVNAAQMLAVGIAFLVARVVQVGDNELILLVECQAGG
jgi:hypothetical protein